MRIPPVPPLAALLVLVACGAPREALVPTSEEARAAPPPYLAETARFDAALADPDAERLGADATALAARADALQARAGALAGPVVDPEVRPRLEAATATP